MFSGKTTELIRHVRTWESAGRSVLACKPHIAHQHNANIESHSGSRIASLDLSSLSSLAEALEGASAVAIDEAQFLDPHSDWKLARAGYYLFNGRLRKAERLAEELVHKEPENISAWALLAQAASRSEPALAARAAAQLKRLDPLDSP